MVTRRSHGAVAVERAAQVALDAGLILRHRAQRRSLVRAAPAPLTHEPPHGAWIDDRKLAAWIGLSRARLQALRRTPHGPPFVRVGKRAIRYSTDAVRRWLATRGGG